jgi:leader peptidase (prepilin peptidase)/N-methyltransferase
MLIPNHLNLILGGISILFTILGWSVSFGQALLGAFLGGGILLGIRVLSLLIIKKEGMGIGDIKLAFICGLYLGPYKILLGLLISVYISGFLLLLLIWLGKIKKNQYIPYGPFLGGGFIISLVFYENIMKLFWWL